MNPSRTRHWLLVVAGDSEPFLVGPLDETELLARARLHRASDPSREDGLYALCVDANGNPSVESFAGAALEP